MYSGGVVGGVQERVNCVKVSDIVLIKGHQTSDMIHSQIREGDMTV